jgi:S-adenosylmethionine:tRNA ribosyltransferase-isomerase
VFAREKGSVAAPTAGLHFTPEVLEDCRARGAEVAYVTLHVGLGTFQPLHAERVEDGRLHAERYQVTEENAAKMRAAKRVVAVGTTSVRTIESAWAQGRMSGETDIFIYPGFQFRGVGAMLTNFHLPRTSLLLLVCAFAGTEVALAAYRHAVEVRYRFYSYGDCMLVV